MLKINRIIIFLFFVFMGCRTQPQCHLQIITNQEKFEIAKSGIFISEDIPTFNMAGKTVTKDSLLKYDSKKYAFDIYKDCNNKAVKRVIRYITEEDKMFAKRGDSLFNSDINLYIKYIKFSEKDTLRQKKWIEWVYYSQPLKARNVDCDSIATLLSNANNKDTDNRANNGIASMQVDRENQILVKSIIEKCGFEAIEKQGKKAVLSAFMITQHAQPALRAEYYTYFENAVKKKLLSNTSLSVMIDRILMEKGEPQLYGTQWEIDPKNGDNILYPLKYPKRVNILRDSMEIPFTLEEYMRTNNIKFKQ
jgi:hypothetical protein